MNELLQVAGRFHVVLLHLPIGMLSGLFLLELVSVFRRDSIPKAAIRAFAVASALSAIVAAVTGFLLHYENGFDTPLVYNHKVLGFVLAGCAFITACCYFRSNFTVPRRLALLITMGVLVPTGHYGGTITHGDNFLLAPLSAKARDTERARAATSPPADDAKSAAASPPVDPLAAAVPVVIPAGLDVARYNSVIAPILEHNCINCHGTNKRKGDLELHTLEAILKGGHDGDVLIVGDSKASELVRRLHLPIEDEDHMPPEDKPQLTAAQITEIESWIDSEPAVQKLGAATSTETKPTDEHAAHAPAAQAPAAPIDVVAVAAVLPAPAEALSRLHDNLIAAEPLAQGSNQLIVSLAAIASTADDKQVAALLTPLQPQIADLSLARSLITDEAIATVLPMQGLQRLDLRATAITSAGLSKLSTLPALQDLILSQTKLTDDAADMLIAMPKLRRVYLWKSGLSESAIAKLREKRPELLVDAGDRSETVALDKETELKFTGDAPPVDHPPQAAAPTDLTPINTTCPVTGDPISPKFQIVYKGRVVGFCCPNCPQKFWTDPGTYEAKLPPVK